jgi:formate C-acetyltransferase
MNHLEAVNAALLDPALSDPPPADADSLFARLEPAIRDRVVTACRYAQDRACLLAERVPTPFTSALMRGNVAEGRDLHVWQPFALEGFFERGLTNAANALAAIGATVFHESRLPWGELIAALRADFPDAPLRQRLRAAPKWGNDDPRADRWAIRLLEARERALRHAESTFGQPRHLPCHVVRSLHHLDGKRIAASPDGRLAGAAVADSIGAETGTARRGPTALLNSVLKIESPRFYGGGYNLNLTLLAADTRPDTLDALITGFFRAGGQELQVNVLDAATLRDAQRSPARYPDLVVRVAGLSARFVDLPTVEQDELIQRAESAHTA